jgi:hypothetical protein
MRGAPGGLGIEVEHTYFVHYSFKFKATGLEEKGNDEISRIGPISNINDVRDIEAHITMKLNSSGIDAHMVCVSDWKLFSKGN